MTKKDKYILIFFFLIIIVLFFFYFFDYTDFLFSSPEKTITKFNVNDVENRKFFIKSEQSKTSKYNSSLRDHIEENLPSLLHTTKWQKYCILDFYPDNKNFGYVNSAKLIYVLYVYPTGPGFLKELYTFLGKSSYMQEAIKTSDIFVEMYYIVPEKANPGKKTEVWVKGFFLNKDNIWYLNNYFSDNWEPGKEEAMIHLFENIRLEIYRVPKNFDPARYVFPYINPFPGRRAI